MRNIGTRINEHNVVEVYGGYVDEEYENALRILGRALEATPGGFTPSEERVIDGFTKWYMQIEACLPYKTKNPAYVYMNVNTGVSLLFLIRVPYEGCLGGDGMYQSVKVPEQFD